ncbi:PRC and DUF2382 domain-containing protein [Kitasatospora sp. MAP5-34]|uniref:PRC and DUF2382 domain-containing protein n=1 Tax=Kitasatospora sp. MAP5-34 TaxID=3035102 RepID=UPI0024753D7C|nr:PRC and DUF2382 domain-containing protein [Kitasatospora sp. MAP5-34]MDH6580042.1 sporulation protein YlmC with PRC-barrel domain [Kitasatospora sp. MAP5-34]
MQTDIDPRDLIGHKAVDRNGDKIGTVDEVYLDDATGEPEWAAVRTGIFGRDAFVPLTTSEFSGEELKVPYDKSLIKESPDFGVGQHLSPAQELQLYRYYGLDTNSAAPPPSAGNGSRGDLDFGATPNAGTQNTTVQNATIQTGGTQNTTVQNGSVQNGAAPNGAPPMAFTASADHQKTSSTLEKPMTSAPTTAAPMARPTEADTRNLGAPTVERPGMPAAATSSPNGPVEITCREERLEITTEWHTIGTATLRKYVTTEAVERRVPVVRERVRVERVPVTEAERASLSEQEIADATEEVTLREERPVVHKYLAPIERVRLVVERYTEEALIREDLRREQVEIQDSSMPAAPSAPATAQSAGGQLPSNARPEPLRPS